MCSKFLTQVTGSFRISVPNKVLLLTCHVVNLVSVTELLFLYKPFKDFQRCDHFVSAAENEQNHKGLPN